MNYSNELAKILQKAGWFEGRKIAINEYLSWYRRYGFSPSTIITSTLEEFGDLTFRIPFLKEITHGREREQAYWEFYISPLYFIDDTFSKCDIEDSICYVRTANQFLSLSLVPLARATDFDDLSYDIFMADTGEIVGAYEGTCGVLGHDFFSALNTLMTENNISFHDFL